MGCNERVLRGKFRAINAYVKKEERPQINYLIFHLKELAEEQTQSKESRRKEIRLEWK